MAKKPWYERLFQSFMIAFTGYEVGELHGEHAAEKKYHEVMRYQGPFKRDEPVEEIKILERPALIVIFIILICYFASKFVKSYLKKTLNNNTNQRVSQECPIQYIAPQVQQQPQQQQAPRQIIVQMPPNSNNAQGQVHIPVDI